jgi:hypothetical protein
VSRLFLATLVGVTVVTSTPTWAQRRNVPHGRTGDQAVEVARKGFEASVEARVVDRRAKCMNAFGSSTFCNCLSAALPLEVDFQRYIAVTTTDNDAVRRSDPDQQIADVILATRDRCVAAAFRSP